MRYYFLTNLTEKIAELLNKKRGFECKKYLTGPEQRLEL